MASRREEQREVRMKTAQDLAEQTRGFEPTAVKLPEGVEWFAVNKLKDGDTPLVDFMPYIAGDGNPDCDEGWGYYRRKYLVHRLPTPKAPKGMPFCCESNFGRRCRICRWLEKVANADLAKDCKAKARYLWLVNDKPGTEPGTKDNPWKVFDSNDWNKGLGFREIMQDAINDAEGGAEFCDLKKGLVAKLTVKQQPGFGGDSKPYNAVTRVSFRPRKHTYSSKLLAAAPCLDAMLIDTPAEQLDELLGDGDAVAPAEEPKRKAGPKSRHDNTGSDIEPDSAIEPSDVDSQVEDAAGSDVEPDSAVEPKKAGIAKGDFVTYKGKEYEVLKVSGDGTSLTLEDQDGKQKHAGPAECKKVKVADAGSDVEEDSVTEDSATDGSDAEDSATEDSATSSDVEDSVTEDSVVEPPAKKKPAAKAKPSSNGKTSTAKMPAKKPARKP